MMKMLLPPSCVPDPSEAFRGPLIIMSSFQQKTESKGKGLSKGRPHSRAEKGGCVWHCCYHRCSTWGICSPWPPLSMPVHRAVFTHKLQCCTIQNSTNAPSRTAQMDSTLLSLWWHQSGPCGHHHHGIDVLICVLPHIQLDFSWAYLCNHSWHLSSCCIAWHYHTSEYQGAAVALQ